MNPRPGVGSDGFFDTRKQQVSGMDRQCSKHDPLRVQYHAERGDSPSQHLRRLCQRRERGGIAAARGFYHGTARRFAPETVLPGDTRDGRAGRVRFQAAAQAAGAEAAIGNDRHMTDLASRFGSAPVQ